MNTECFDKLEKLANGVISFTPTEIMVLKECAQELSAVDRPTLIQDTLRKVFLAAAKGEYFDNAA